MLAGQPVGKEADRYVTSGDDLDPEEVICPALLDLFSNQLWLQLPAISAPGVASWMVMGAFGPTPNEIRARLPESA